MRNRMTMKNWKMMMKNQKMTMRKVKGKITTAKKKKMDAEDEQICLNIRRILIFLDVRLSLDEDLKPFLSHLI